MTTSNEQPDPLYDAGSMVFVPYEGGKHYQARIMKKDLRKYTHPDGTTVPMWFYHVHYMGWNKKYDEWVEETGCRTDNPDEEPLQNNKKAKVTKPGDKTPQMALAIPPMLKQQLVQDHDAVKKDGRLLPLPRTPSVEQILAAYIKSQQKGVEVDQDAEQVANGIRTYFDRSLGLLLLYAEERKQADTYIADGTLPSAVYGAEHLLRLFVKLPEYLPIAGMTDDQYKLLQGKLHELLDWLLGKMPEYFVPAQEYLSPMEA